MHSFISLVRTKCGGSIPRGPGSGSGIEMTSCQAELRQPRCTEPWRAPLCPAPPWWGASRSPPCTHQLKCQRLSASNGHLWSKLFQQYKDSESIFQHRSKKGGKGGQTQHNNPFIQTRKPSRKYKVFQSFIQNPLKSTEALSIYIGGHWRRL